MYETFSAEDWLWLEKLTAVSSGRAAPDIPRGVAGRLLEQGFIARSGRKITVTRKARKALALRRPPPPG